MLKTMIRYVYNILYRIVSEHTMGNPIIRPIGKLKWPLKKSGGKSFPKIWEAIRFNKTKILACTHYIPKIVI